MYSYICICYIKMLLREVSSHGLISLTIFHSVAIVMYIFALFLAIQSNHRVRPLFCICFKGLCFELMRKLKSYWYGSITKCKEKKKKHMKYAAFTLINSFYFFVAIPYLFSICMCRCMGSTVLMCVYLCVEILEKNILNIWSMRLF